MKTLLGGLFISCLALTVVAQGQHPTLTTEDVIKWRLAHPELAENYIPKMRLKQHRPGNPQPMNNFWPTKKTGIIA